MILKKRKVTGYEHSFILAKNYYYHYYYYYYYYYNGRIT